MIKESAVLYASKWHPEGSPARCSLFAEIDKQLAEHRAQFGEAATAFDTIHWAHPPCIRSGHAMLLINGFQFDLEYAQ